MSIKSILQFVDSSGLLEGEGPGRAGGAKTGRPADAELTVNVAGTRTGAMPVIPPPIYPASLRRIDGALVLMARLSAAEVTVPSVTGPAGGGASQRVLLVISRDKPGLGFEGPTTEHGSYFVQEALPAPYNLGPLWALLPWTRPVSLRDRRTTIGFGDRLGLATPGHIRAARAYRVAPVLAQQSMRELAFTGRSFADVVTDAAFHVFAEGYEEGYGADGDHLKTIPDIDRALQWGMPMVTLDLTDVMHPEAAELSDSEVETRFRRLPSDFRSRIESTYVDKTVAAGPVSIPFDGSLARRCAVMYADALFHARAVAEHLARMTGGKFDLEISVDETTTPTLPSHHLFIARELENMGVAVSSLAPRFIGEFQKGIDYIGDLAEFERQFTVHAEIARAAGGYKVSVHSGSDKLSVYPVVGRETKHRLHLKTAGTSWLEAIRTIASHDPDLYRVMHERAFLYFPEASKSYVIKADLNKVQPLDERADARLPDYLNDDNCRQLLHISYGGLLRDPEVRDRLFSTLHAHEVEHVDTVTHHMERHLDALGLDRL